MDLQGNLADSLMVRAAAGEREAFGRLAELAGPAVERFSLAQLPPPLRDQAADVRQECLLRAYQGRKRFRPGGDAIAWLLGIAMNVVRERRRKQRPGPPLATFDPPQPAPSPLPDGLDDLAAAVEALPDRQREAVVCRFLRGLSVAQTAEVMGCAQGTVKATVFKAMANLRTRMRANENANAHE